MPTIDLTPQTHRDLHLISHARNEAPGQTVSFLIECFHQAATGQGSATAPTESRGVQVHVIYQGNRVEGVYDPLSNTLTVTSGALASQTFNTPSGAAKAIVASIKPGVTPNRSGFDFWFVTSTGETLRSVRQK